MARKILIIFVAILTISLAGCYKPNSGASQLLTKQLKQMDVSVPSDASQADIVEQVTMSRNSYRESLKQLVKYYDQTGNNMKYQWAKTELNGLNDIPQYHYIIEAAVAGPELSASASINEADYMYKDAWRTEKDARLLFFTDDDKLRAALRSYNRLIEKHPSSNKIDDAAFRSAKILQHFKDYALALIYYKRAYQWNPETPYPARFKAAYILDKYMGRRDEALELYRKALETEDLKQSYKEYAKLRISELTSNEQNAN